MALVAPLVVTSVTRVVGASAIRQEKQGRMWIYSRLAGVASSGIPTVMVYV